MANVLGVEIGSVEKRFAAYQYGSFYQILEFTDISGERQTAQELHGVGGEVGVRQSVGCGLAVGKMACQQRDIFTTFTQGGQFYCYQVNAVEQVFAERTFAHHLTQVGVGGGDYTDIRFAGTAVAEHFKSLVLQYAQQFHLAGRVEVTDFIEEDGAFVRHLETSDTVGGSISESSFLVTEHFALEQALGDATQIDFHKRVLSTLAVDMDSFGYEFLTCAALARD